MSALTNGDVSLADAGTDGRPPVRHAYRLQLPPPWTSLCGQMVRIPPFTVAGADDERCVVCVDLCATH